MRKIAGRVFCGIGLVVIIAICAVAVVWVAVGGSALKDWAVYGVTGVLDDRFWEVTGSQQPPYVFSPEDRAILDQAERRIKTRAGRTTTVQLLDPNGRPVPEGTEVVYTLRNPAFGWGNFDESSPQLAGLWGPRRNRSYVLSTWTMLYRDDLAITDFRAAEVFYPTQWQRAVGIKVAWHNAVWLIDKDPDDPNAELTFPEELRGMAFPEQRRRILDWTRQVATYTDGRFDVVNVFNEPLNEWTDPYAWGKVVRRQLLEEVVRTFRAHNSSSEIQISIGESLTTHDGEDAEWLVSWIKARDLPVDRIALQLWSNGFFEWGEAMPSLNLQQVHDRLTAIAAHGIPLDITEFQAPRAGVPRMHWWWTPERQAAWAASVATVAFSLPGVESFCYFRTRDNFMLDGGLFDAQHRPAPVADRLFGRIDEWTSRGKAVTEAGGRIGVTGFAGEYLISPDDESGPGEVQWVVTIDPSGESTLRVKARPVPASAPAAIAHLGPAVTADHYLDVVIESRAESQPRPANADSEALLAEVQPLLWKNTEPGPKGMRRHNGNIEIGGYRTGGFCLDRVPNDARRLVIELTVLDRGVDLGLNIFDQTRRYSDAAFAPGSYRISIPVDAGSRPALQLIPRVGDYPIYKVGEAKYPTARLESAWFESHASATGYDPPSAVGGTNESAMAP